MVPDERGVKALHSSPFTYLITEKKAMKCVPSAAKIPSQ